MAGIYIHIPFCKKACHYCNFHFSTTGYYKDEMIAYMNNELRLQQNYLSEHIINTIYFGGGTPSILPTENIKQLLQTIYDRYKIIDNPEITLEANPDDLTLQKLQELKQAGINRLSIGIQSFFEEDLEWMNRAHHAQQALTCLEDAKATGFSNISIDLIYGGPTLTDEHWQQNVSKAIELGIPHLSCYALTVEPGTALDHFIQKKKVPVLDPDKAARHFEMLMQWTAGAGYEHYEISNFALPRKHSQHNSNYWKGVPYLGIGPSAHSYNGTTRQWNVANNQLYIQSLTKETVPFELEVLTPSMQLNEYIMTSLRTAAGCDLQHIALHFGEDIQLKISSAANSFIHKGLMIKNDDHLQLTKQGKFLADGIAADLFV